MTETSTLGLNYGKIRIFLGKRALTPYNINTWLTSVWAWKRFHRTPQLFSKSKIICHFFKRGHREVEKTFNQVFFMLLYINIYTKLSFFPVNIGYFRVKMTETSTLSLNYEKIRIFLGKRALTPYNITTWLTSVWAWKRFHRSPQLLPKSKIIGHFFKRGHREVEKPLIKFFSCYCI